MKKNIFIFIFCLNFINFANGFASELDDGSLDDSRDFNFTYAEIDPEIPEITASHEASLYALSQTQINHFYEEGYLLLTDLFTKEIPEILESPYRTLERAKRLTESGRVMDNGTIFVIDILESMTQIHRVIWAGASEPSLLTTTRQHKLLLPVAQLLGSHKPDQLSNQIHFKLPNDGVEFPPHQDMKHRRRCDKNWRNLNKKGSFVQTIIAVDPMTPENGGIWFIPDSHKFGEINPEEVSHMAERLSSEKRFINMNPGDVLILHPYLIHGSNVNTSEHTRIAVINGYAYPGAHTEPIIERDTTPVKKILGETLSLSPFISLIERRTSFTPISIPTAAEKDTSPNRRHLQSSPTKGITNMRKSATFERATSRILANF